FANSRAGKVAIVDGSLADGNYRMASLGSLYSGQSASERFGAWADGEVDVNGDGAADLVVAAVGTASVSIWFGPLAGGGSSAAPDATISGVELTTNATSFEANCISCLGTAGDVTDDGYEDLLIGSDGSDLGNQADAGAAYVMAGPISSSTSTSAAAATFLGFAANDFVGRSVAGGGDIDADGRGDLLISAHGVDVVDGEGRVALVYGPVSGTVYHRDLPGFLGTEVRANLGAALAMVGDVDGDQAEDFLLGAPNALNSNGAGVGRAYLYYGAGE
ncbi:MAG TPA: integrin alpha, partial [Myxococcota bacterium]|nr:integrin alpha [Myxococcota bacterium]